MNACILDMHVFLGGDFPLNHEVFMQAKAAIGLQAQVQKRCNATKRCFKSKRALQAPSVSRPQSAASAEEAAEQPLTSADVTILEKAALLKHMRATNKCMMQVNAPGSGMSCE